MGRKQRGELLQISWPVWAPYSGFRLGRWDILKPQKGGEECLMRAALLTKQFSDASMKAAETGLETQETSISHVARQEKKTYLDFEVF